MRRNHSISYSEMEPVRCSEGMKYVKGHRALMKDNKSCGGKLRHVARQNKTMLLIVAGIAVGFCLGLILRHSHPTDETIMWIGMPGVLYLRLLTLTIVPIVICGVITGASRLDPKTNGKIGLCVVILAMLTNIASICLSAGLVLLIKPGVNSQNVYTHKLTKAMKTSDVFTDLLKNLFPDNIIGATLRQTVTTYVEVDREDEILPIDSVPADNTNTTSGNNTLGGEGFQQEYKKVMSYSHGVNVLGLITVSAVFGMASGQMRNKARTFLKLTDNLFELTLLIVKWFYWLTPLGVLSLIAQSIAKLDNLFDTLSDLGLFVLTVLIALVIHSLVILPLTYVIIVRKNPLKFFMGHVTAMAIAFGSTVSSIVMPQMIEVSENKFKMDKRVTRLAVPFLITINADGSAAFMVAASVFLSSFSGVAITSQTLVVIIVLTIVSTLAIPGVPSASIFSIIIILTAVHVPVQNVAMLFASEWFLDRVRTAVNVQSHVTIVALTDKLCRGMLRDLDDAATTKIDESDDDDDDNDDGKDNSDVESQLVVEDNAHQSSAL